jgi:peroxiredoxin
VQTTANESAIRSGPNNDMTQAIGCSCIHNKNGDPMIEVGGTLPEAVFSVLEDGEMKNPHTGTLFSDKKVVVFAVPGAFTPTCSAAHLPGFVALADKIKAKGVDDIICISVNDAFVMDAWGKSQNASEIKMVADGNGAFTQLIGLDMDTDAFGGLRSIRYSMIVDDGVVSALNVEDPGRFEVSDAETILKQL